MGSLPSTPAKDAAHPANGTVKCHSCGSDVSELVRHCPTCQKDLGFPNVRAATTPGEIEVLSRRFEAARKSATGRGVQAEFDSLVSEVASKSYVVVAMPPLSARNLLFDPREIFTGYEKLVESGSRQPSSMQNDRDRCAVGGRLFGSFAKEICCGVLSLDGTGLQNYGLVFLRLRDVAVDQRVSFLEENSYHFLDHHNVPVRGALPQGYRSAWHNRGELAAAKIEPMLTAGSSAANWARQIVVQGATRSDDEFIEAHIYGGFDAKAVESVVCVGAGASRAEKIDIACIKEYMAKRRSPGGTT